MKQRIDRWEGKGMECSVIQQRLPDFLSGVLTQEENDEIQLHIMQCSSCQNEVSIYKSTWKILDVWDDVDPDSDYRSRFWTRVARQRPWYGQAVGFSGIIAGWRRTALVTAGILVAAAMAAVTWHSMWDMHQTETLLTVLSAEEIEFVENIEMLEHLELLEQLELFEDWDMLEAFTGEEG